MMAERRFILEMGQGVSLHGMDATKAAIRAVEDALRHSSLSVLATCGIGAAQMRVAVTVAVPRPEEVDAAAVAAALPHGRAEVRAVAGGLEIPEATGGGAHLIAVAAVEAFLPDQAGKWRAG